MLRQIGGFFSFISAILCIGVIVLAVRSRHHVDTLLVETTGGHLAGAVTDHYAIIFASTDLPYTGLVSTDGSVHRVGVCVVTPEDFKPFLDSIFSTTTIKFSFLGFKTAAGQTAVTSQLSPRFAALRLPCWFLAIVFAVLPLGIGRSAWTRFRWKRKGLCLGCGYDIRASTGRCPECGKEIPASVSNAGAR